MGGDLNGLRHAISTFVQAVRLCHAYPVAAAEAALDPAPEDDNGVPPLRIVDWPDLPNRGFMLDVSRDKVPVHENEIVCCWT